jgi:hypothetical protein
MLLFIYHIAFRKFCLDPAMCVVLLHTYLNAYQAAKGRHLVFAVVAGIAGVHFKVGCSNHLVVCRVRDPENPEAVRTYRPTFESCKSNSIYSKA